MSRQQPQVYFAIPGELQTVSGGYAYDRRLLRELGKLGRKVQVLSLDSSFPHPDELALKRTAEALAALPPDSLVLIDGLAHGALPVALLRGCGHRLVALVHHPLAEETGLPQALARDMAQRERAALAEAQAVIATSAHTARTLEGTYGVPADKLTVALPGMDAGGRAVPDPGQPPLILSVGNLMPRKGHVDLVSALAMLADRPWRAAICGNLSRDPQTTAAVEARRAATGLCERIELLGEVETTALARLYRQASIFAMAAYHEGYGMAFAEALCHGLPVVGYAAGAVPDTVGEAGLLVPTGDIPALAGALGRLLDDEQERRRLAEVAWQRGQTLPGWEQTARAVLAVLDGSQRAAA